MCIGACICTKGKGTNSVIPPVRFDDFSDGGTFDYLVRVGKLSPEFDSKGLRTYSPEVVDQVIEILANRRRKGRA